MAERNVELDRAPTAEAEVRGAAPGFEVGAGGRSVREHDHFHVTREDGRGRVLDHELPRGAADARSVDPRGAQAQVLADLDGGEHAHAARPEAVDVVLGEPGVGQRSSRGLVVQLERSLDVDAADVGQRGADDCDFLRSRHQRSFHSTRLPDANIFCPSAIDSWLVPIATYA